MNMPSDARYMVAGVPHKIGSHGLPFRWNGEEWVRSTKSVAEVRAGKEITKGRVVTPTKSYMFEVVD